MSYLPKNWRDRLPDPAVYYAANIERLKEPDASGNAVGHCPFADALIEVNLSGRGVWTCAGERGDMVTFHKRLFGVSFPFAVRQLIRLDPIECEGADGVGRGSSD